MAHSFFQWLYARRRNFVLATALAYGVPMYLLVVALKGESDWVVDLVFVLSTLAGSIGFSFATWFAFGKSIADRWRR
jgi:hypothetical protein